MPTIKKFWLIFNNYKFFIEQINKHIKTMFRGDIIKSLFKAVAIITIFSVLTRLMGFVFKIFLSRTLPASELGIYTIVVSVFIVFATVLSSGLPLAVSKSTTINGNNPKKSTAAVSSALIISLILSTIITAIILLAKPLLAAYFKSDTAYTLLLYMIPAIVFTGIYSPFKGYLWGKEKFFYVSIVEFIEQIIRIGCFFIFVYFFNFSNDLFPAGISVSVACVLSTILGILFFYLSKGRLNSPKNHFKSVFKSATPITLVRLFTGLMQPLMAFLLPIRLVVAGFTNEQALGQLGIAMGMTLPLLTIPSTLIGSLATAIVPNITELNNKQNYSKLKSQISSAINFTICCSFIVLPFFIAVGEQCCLFLFDNTTAGTYLKYGCWIIIPMGISQITTSILNSLNLETKTFKYYIYSCIVLLACIFLLPKYIGIYSLLFGMGLSTATIAILNIIKINKTVKTNKTYLPTLLKLTMFTLPTTLLTKWSYKIIALIFPKFISLIIVGLISVICFTVLMTTFNVIDITYFTGIYNRKISINKRKKAQT